MNNKILLLAAGRRYSFVKRLQSHNFEVYSFENEYNVPISKICKVFVCTDDRREWASIKQILDKYNIQYVLPLSCSLAEKAGFELDTSQVIGGTYFASRTCYNKKILDLWMKEHYPSNYPGYYEDSKNLDVVIKPKYGNGSKNIEYCTVGNKNVVFGDHVVVQKRIYGTEYSVDAYFDIKGKCIGSVPRTRERVSGGEVIDSTTTEYPELSKLTQNIGERLGLRGSSCFQYIVDHTSKVPYLIEINARFGGGCILSLEAGFDMLDMIKTEYYEGKVLYTNYHIKWGLQMKRVNMETFFEHK